MEWTSIVVALLSLLGTLVGTYAGIVSASKVTEWRIRQLESKISALETKVDKLTQQVNLIQGRMEALHSDWYSNYNFHYADHCIHIWATDTDI